jgi:type II secretory pathway pseudopilin PulG
VNRTSRQSQHGWSLIEIAIATALLGLMVVAVVTTARKATNDVEMRRTTSDTERADNALFGYIKANARMPMPDDSAASPSRPGYIEGWLPLKTLGLDGLAGRVRYVVAQALTAPQKIYVADPADLGDGEIKKRTTTNGLDFCATLMRQENAGVALPGGMRLSYALQQTASAASGTPSGSTQIWLGDTASGALPNGIQLSTRTHGFGELAVSLDCFSRFAMLSRDVRATAVAIDLRRLADQEVALREVNKDIGDDSRINNKIREAVWTTGGLKLAIDAGMMTVTALTSPDATIAGDIAAAGLLLVVAGTVDLVKYTTDNIIAGVEAAKVDAAAVETARRYRDALDLETKRQTLLANQLQEKGLDQ